MDPETGHATRLLSAEGYETNPEASPNGTRVVYQEWVTGSGSTSQIYVLEADGAHTREPWRPPPAPAISQIFVLEPDGSVRQLTDLKHGAQDPTWSPDGRRIAFAGGSRRTGDIYVMNADGSHMHRLAGTPKRDVHPDWSPDGTRIAFNTTWCGRSQCKVHPKPGSREWAGIWAASFPGGSLSRLTNGRRGDGDHDAVWSPGGEWIAFVRDWPCEEPCFANPPALWLMRPDGTGRHLLLEEGVDSMTWSPDGSSIASSAGTRAIRIVDVETERVRSLRLSRLTLIRDLSWGTLGIVGSFEK